MLISDKTYEIHCCKDMDNPTKDCAWYVLASFSTKYAMEQHWKETGCTKRRGYRKVEIIHEMKVLK